MVIKALGNRPVRTRGREVGEEDNDMSLVFKG